MLASDLEGYPWGRGLLRLELRELPPWLSLPGLPGTYGLGGVLCGAKVWSPRTGPGEATVPVFTELGYKGKATSDGLHEVARVTQLLHL